MSKIIITKQEEYEVIPEGTYEVYVEAFDAPEMNGELERSSFLLRVRDDIEQSQQNRAIFVNVNTNPNIAWKLSNIAIAAGVEEGSDFESFEDYLNAIKGASMKVVVKHRTYNDKVYADVKKFFPTSEAEYVVVDDEDSLI